MVRHPWMGWIITREEEHQSSLRKTRLGTWTLYAMSMSFANYIVIKGKSRSLWCYGPFLPLCGLSSWAARREAASWDNTPAVVLVQLPIYVWPGTVTLPCRDSLPVYKMSWLDQVASQDPFCYMVLLLCLLENTTPNLFLYERWALFLYGDWEMCVCISYLDILWYQTATLLKNKEKMKLWGFHFSPLWVNT